MNLRSLRPLLELALAQAATFAFPLVFAIVCGRNLGLEGYGEIAFYTALGGFLGVIVEFGFDWLGIREVTQNPADAEHCRQTLLHITVVRVLLALAIGAGMSAALWAWRGDAHGLLILGTWAYLLGFALDAGWYLRAQEHTRLLLGVTLAARAAGIAALVLLVNGPQAQATAIWIYAFVVAAGSALTWLCLWRLHLIRGPWRLLRTRLRELMRQAFAILLGNLNGAMLGHGGVALLGLVSDPATVGAASLALRVKTAALAVLSPLQQWSFVRLSRHARSAPVQMRRDGRRTLVALMALGVLLALGAMAAAPAISEIVFHERVPTAIALIGLLALSIPVYSAGNLLGVQSLVSLGRERSFAIILSAASLVFCALLLLLDGPLAYGWALLAAEGLILVACGLTVRHTLRSLEGGQVPVHAARAAAPAPVAQAGPAERGVKVSIVVNCYHYAAYVGQAVRSALAQTWPDTEVIVVDDGSTDGSREAILACGPRVRTLFKANGGQGSAYNAGFAAASGELVIFLDADDWLYPEAAERIARAWTPEVSKLQFRLDVVGADGRPNGRHLPTEMHDQDALALVSAFGSYGTPPGSGNAYSASFLRQVLPMDERPWRLAADSVPILLAPAYGRVVSLREALGAYRVHRAASADALLFNNAPHDLWSEFERVQRCQALVAAHLQRLDRWVRCPLLLAPWDARLVALCLRFGTPHAAHDRPPRWRMARWALQSLWHWPGLGPAMKLVQSVWMMGLWLLPRPLARPIGRLDRLFRGAPNAS